MSKKFIKNSQLTSSRQLTEAQNNKIADIKLVSSPCKKPPISSKISANYKNSQPSSNIKNAEEDSQFLEEPAVSNQRSKIKQEGQTTSNMQQKSVRKVLSPVSASQSAKKFSKTSKIPTLKSTTGKVTSDECQSNCIKSIQSKMSAQQISAEPSSINTMTEHQSSALSVLKSQLEMLKTQKEQVKKQNQKLSKKIQKLRSLNDQNKKLLKQRIESFNSEGQSLRKFKEEINRLEGCVEVVKGRVVQLEEENNGLREEGMKVKRDKVQREIQTVVLEEVGGGCDGSRRNNFVGLVNPEMGELQIQQNQQKLKNADKKYQSSSSRKSYGGILPLETVVKLNASRFKINFKTNPTTPKKNPPNQPKLMDKYENYWSQKFGKQPKKQKGQQQDCEWTLEARSEYMANVKRFNSSEKHGKMDELAGLELVTNAQKIVQNRQLKVDEVQYANGIEEDSRKQQNAGNVNNNIARQPKRPRREDYRKQLQGRIQSLRCFSGQTQYLHQIHNQKQLFSPTILIQNYRKISQQQQLIKSLYRVIQELSKEIETIEKREDDLIKENRQLKFCGRKVAVQRDTSGRMDAERIVVRMEADQMLLQQMKDDTFLLDQTKEENNCLLDQRPKKPKLTSAQRINQLLIFENYEPLATSQQPQHHPQLYKIQSANNPHLNQSRIIDEISRFCHSEILRQDSTNTLIGIHQHPNNSFDEMQHIQGKSSENKSSTKEEDAFKNIDLLDIKVLDEEMMREDEDENRMKIQDSLDALQYFSDHTPQNINLSQNVSGINDTLLNQLNTTQKSEEIDQCYNQSQLIIQDGQNSLKSGGLSDIIESIGVIRETLIRVEESGISDVGQCV